MKTHVGQVFPKIICDSFEHQVPTEPVPVEGKDGIQNGSRALWVLVAVSRQLLAGLQVEIEGTAHPASSSGLGFPPPLL